MAYKKKDIENTKKDTNKTEEKVEIIENTDVKEATSATENVTTQENKSPTKTVEKIIERVIETPIKEDDTRLDKKVTVRSIAPWITGAPRITTNGDISIPPKGTVLLSREEVIAQAQNGNRLINGIDSFGSHATWYIEDEFARSELSFDNIEENKEQVFLTKDSVKELFNIKNQKTFENEIQDKVITRAEKAYLIECIKDSNFNDYSKIDFCANYTGIRP